MQKQAYKVPWKNLCYEKTQNNCLWLMATSCHYRFPILYKIYNKLESSWLKYSLLFDRNSTSQLKDCPKNLGLYASVYGMSYYINAWYLSRGGQKRGQKWSKSMPYQLSSTNYLWQFQVATTSQKVSVLCPLGKMRMKVPCRPVTCEHLQCFDANTFLQMNEKKSTWWEITWYLN